MRWEFAQLEGEIGKLREIALELREQVVQTESEGMSEAKTGGLRKMLVACGYLEEGIL